MATEKRSGNKVTGNLFKPGESGNPSGRPKGAKRIAQLAREKTEEAMEALIAALAATKTVGWGENMSEVVDHATRLAAANAILDRGWGKPCNINDMPREEDDPTEAAALTDSDLLKEAIARAKKIGTGN